MSNLNFNRVTLAGRICSDLQPKTTKDTYSVKFRLAVHREGKSGKTDYIQMIAFNNTADFIYSCFDKGDAILINGSLNIDVLEKNENEKIWFTSVVVREAFFVDSKADKEEEREKYLTEKYGNQASQQSDDSDDDLPF